ncbi:MAG: DUF2283 domain-containing protein [Chloroflexi bacterium]|nr:DUF2283 domain-containing protein [Chloroflexota bacterium]
MKISYDRDEDILLIETASDATIDHAEHSGQFIAHLTKEGKLVLLEILDASEFLASVVKATARGKLDEMAPAR